MYGLMIGIVVCDSFLWFLPLVDFNWFVLFLVEDGMFIAYVWLVG
jgi:hypothetical protein